MKREWKRSVLHGLALVLGALCVRAGEVPLDENAVALFSDTHVTADATCAYSSAGLERCIRAVLACNPRPAHALFYGDLSVNHGVTNDYRVFKKLVEPLENAGIQWSACMGNHDRRGAFLAVFPEHDTRATLVPDRLVSVVRTPRADFILLDSCLEGPVNGAVDDVQRTWLQKTLAHYGKPVFVGAHHPIGETRLAELLAAHTDCTAYIHGHNHYWKQRKEGGVETLCLPSTGWWGDIGYVMVKLDAEGATFTLHQFDYYAPRPAARPEDVKPEWTARVRKNDGLTWRVTFR